MVLFFWFWGGGERITTEELAETVITINIRGCQKNKFDSQKVNALLV